MLTDREIFRDNLKHYLDTSGKLQRELADYVGAKYTTVSGWTRGISYPRADAMEKIANFFGIPTSELVGNRSSQSMKKTISNLSDTEQSIVFAYRKASSDTQKAVLNVLGIKEYNSHREIVEEYLRTHNPSSMRTEVPFNLRGFISYVDANHITDPNEIPDDIIESFFHHEAKKTLDE